MRQRRCSFNDAVWQIQNLGCVYTTVPHNKKSTPATFGWLRNYRGAGGRESKSFVRSAVRNVRWMANNDITRKTVYSGVSNYTRTKISTLLCANCCLFCTFIWPLHYILYSSTPILIVQLLTLPPLRAIGRGERGVRVCVCVEQNARSTHTHIGATAVGSDREPDSSGHKGGMTKCSGQKARCNTCKDRRMCVRCWRGSGGVCGCVGLCVCVRCAYVCGENGS